MDQRPVHQLESSSMYEENIERRDETRALPNRPEEQVETRQDGPPTPSYFSVIPNQREQREASPGFIAIPGNVVTPKYNGKTDVRSWLLNYRYACQAYGFNDEKMYSQLYYSLEAPILDWFLADKIEAENRQQNYGWPEFQTRIIDLMEGRGDKFKTKLRLMHSSQQKNEDWTQYFHSKRLLIEIHSPEINVKDKLLYIWDGLESSLKARVEKKFIKLLEDDSPTIHDLFQEIKYVQGLTNPIQRSQQSGKPNPNQRPANEDQVNQLIKAVGKLATQQNAKRDNRNDNRVDRNEAREKGLCFKCGKSGHLIADCPLMKTNEAKNE